MQDWQERLKALNLTKTELKIANYLLDQPQAAGLKTATELAAAIGVSDSSVIRLTRRLGYGGFGDFQKQLQENLQQQWQEALAPSQKFHRPGGPLGAQVWQQAQTNLQKASEQVEEQAIQQAARILQQSRHKYLAGFRGAAALASFCGSRLRYLLPGVETLTHADSSSLERILDFTDQDCLVIFSFPIYSKIAVTLSQYAAEKRTKIITITDKITSPLFATADLLLTTPVAGVGFSNSYAAAMVLLDWLILQTAEEAGDEALARAQNLDQLLMKQNLY